MAKHILRILPIDLLELTRLEKTFVIRVGKIHLVPQYGMKTFIKGDVLCYKGANANQCEIGIVRNYNAELFGIRILPQSHRPDINKFGTIHQKDIICRLMPYKSKAKKIYRLWMEEQRPGGYAVETTIKIDASKAELEARRRNLEQQARQFNLSYTYHIEECKNNV